MNRRLIIDGSNMLFRSYWIAENGKSNFEDKYDVGTIYIFLKSLKSVVDIFNPDETWVHGIIPDYAIDNVKTKKTIYTEVKSQDGWVEGKKRKDGRGNVHERSNKYFTPGLQRILREKGNIPEDVLPFWVVFQGDIARDPKRVREISLWYEGIESHFLLWHDATNPEQMLSHFEKHIAPLLD